MAAAVCSSSPFQRTAREPRDWMGIIALVTVVSSGLIAGAVWCQDPGQNVRLAAASNPATDAVGAGGKDQHDVAVSQQPRGDHPLDPALALLRQCQERFAAIRDYTALFVKEERIGRTML